MSDNPMVKSMDALLSELDRLDEARTDEEIDSAVKHAKAVQGVVSQVFDGIRTNNETVRLRNDLMAGLPMAKRHELMDEGRKAAAALPVAEPYYQRRRQAMDEA